MCHAYRAGWLLKRATDCAVESLICGNPEISFRPDSCAASRAAAASSSVLYKPRWMSIPHSFKMGKTSALHCGGTPAHVMTGMVPASLVQDRQSRSDAAAIVMFLRIIFA